MNPDELEDRRRAGGYRDHEASDPEEHHPAYTHPSRDGYCFFGRSRIQTGREGGEMREDSVGRITILHVSL